MTTNSTEGDDRNVYLDNQGNYRDNTPENREQYPPLADDAEPVPFTDEGTIDGEQIHADDAGTTTEAGTDAPAEPVAKTRKQS
jgi:hypothetical protein